MEENRKMLRGTPKSMLAKSLGGAFPLHVLHVPVMHFLLYFAISVYTLHKPIEMLRIEDADL